MFKRTLIALVSILLTTLLSAQSFSPERGKINDLLASLSTKGYYESQVSSTVDSTQAKPKEIKSIKIDTVQSPKIKAKPAQTDSVWLKSGETLVGQITFDKDYNAFLFAKDTLNFILKANEVVRLTASPKKNEDERLDVFSFANEFYFLESKPNVAIRLLSHKVFKAVLNDGPKHFEVQTKYCLVKDNVPYFLTGMRTKDILMTLMNDCKQVREGFKSGKFNKKNFIEAVSLYNRCSEASK
jgi:hypothetical protein